MTNSGLIARGRAAFAARRWLDCYDHFSAARERGSIGQDDLDCFAASAYLTGHDSDAISLWTRLHQLHANAEECDRAAKACFWVSFIHMLAGEMAPASGWLSRAERLLDQHGKTCAAHGYIAILNGLRALGGQNPDVALSAFGEALSVSRLFGENDLLALGLLGEGQALALQGKTAAGVSRLDEAMIGVSGGEVGPVLSGIVYCAVILTCQRMFDVQRAREWTIELNQWCAAQPELVPFRGQCLVHRSEILQFQGDWREAMDEAQNACRHLEQRQDTITGRAFYQCGELHRLAGEFDLADQMYREASLHGRDPQPGTALMLLAQGKIDAAATAIASALDGAGTAPSSGRTLLLAPFVEIMLAAGDIPQAGDAAEELSESARQTDAPLLKALADQARGLVHLSHHDLAEALANLRQAWAHWQQLQCPYEAARVRVWLAEIGDRSGDHASARHHRDAARTIFERLGATHDLLNLQKRTGKTAMSVAGFGLSAREHQILTLVARGATNRQIAAQLNISQHTVARHLSNIFDKLGVSTRTAAAAFAHTHGLLTSANSQN